MSVLIKGMNMPKSCDICPFSKTNDDLMSDDYRFRYCDFPYIGYFVTDYEESRHPACPLTPVPPHGRLIDADALRARMYHEAFDTDTPMQRWESGCWIRYKLFERTEEAAPTIIPAEEG